MLQRIKDTVEILVCINAKDIARLKVRADLGILYEDDVLRLIDIFRERGFLVEHVVMTQFEESNEQSVAVVERLRRLGLKVAKHRTIAGYATNKYVIVSEEVYCKHEYYEVTRDFVVVAALGPGSGKLAMALSQVYHELNSGKTAGYAKFEAFPVWNLPLEHPVILAYEAATVDLK